MTRILSILLYFAILIQNALSAVVVPKNVAVVPTVDSLFTLSTGAGSCASKTTVINTYLSECVQLMDALLTAYHSYGTVTAYRTMFEVYLSAKFDGTTVSSDSGQWTTIETRLTNVATFLSGGGITGAKTNTKPRLFCDDTFAELKTWQTVARDGNGKEMFDEDDDEVMILEVYPKIKDRQVAGLESGSVDATISPFWVPSLNGYTFSTLDPSYTTLCQKPGRMALTSRADTNAGAEAGSPSGYTYATFDRHLLLCPDSFSPSGNGPHTIASLSALVSSTNYPVEGLKQLPLSTISATLFHELFHLVDVAGTDNDNNLQSFLPILDASYSKKSPNTVNAPEPYALFATAAYLYQNPPGGDDPVLEACNLGGPSSGTFKEEQMYLSLEVSRILLISWATTSFKFLFEY
ncbi:hypothetical protein N7456_007840 [Penicillium angulare]|uniref:Lysine-specific metallo-endopeptidase domain-containing protein n=1 Tax=Penicillium angulare TaxID=116970 RepID=A0A9W9FBH8_9EURO|nr:hypothetical protein N7456_007840 [Penicillium angulare]